jgi:two-component system, chemotaxis family, chemotaxis protein CheY
MVYARTRFECTVPDSSGGNGLAAAESYVLVVEDDADIRDLLHDVLNEDGFRVKLARHGEQALELLDRGPPPKLVLLDLSMPVMDGWQMRRRMLERPDWAEIPVVVLSALGNRDSHHLRVEASLAKPVDLRHLLGLVKAYVGDSSSAPH